MTRADRERAFSYRLDGLTWEQIAVIMSYSPRTIADELRGVIEKAPSSPQLLYPMIESYIGRHCGGSIRQFADRIRVSPYWVRRCLMYGEKMSNGMKAKILDATGLPPEALKRRM